MCLFPIVNLNCSQGAGFKSDGQVDATSFTHAGAYAYDVCGNDALRSDSEARPGFIPIPEYIGVTGKDGIYKKVGAEPIQ